MSFILNKVKTDDEVAEIIGTTSRQTMVARVARDLAAAVKDDVAAGNQNGPYNITELEVMDEALSDYQTKRREKIAAGDESATLMTVGAIKLKVNEDSADTGVHAYVKVVDGVQSLFFMSRERYEATDGYKAAVKRVAAMKAAKAAKAASK